MNLEIHQIDLRYAHLRVADPVRRGRLLTSLTEQGQATPVLVVSRDDGTFILIDGYARVGALLDLGRDHVAALELDMVEAEALVFAHRLDAARRRSEIEEAWLVSELMERHHMTCRAVGQRLGRSASWVSRRLALCKVLPPKATEAVQRGLVPPHAAAKSLVPLARANKDHCERLVTALGKQRLTDRQVERLYHAWRRADAEGRERIVDQPMLALAAAAELLGPLSPLEPLDFVLNDLDVLVGAGRRARQRLERDVAHLPDDRRVRIAQAQAEVRAVSEGILARLEALCST